MENPNNKEALVAIIDRIFEEFDSYIIKPDAETRDVYTSEMEKLKYEFENGSKYCNRGTLIPQGNKIEVKEISK